MKKILAILLTAFILVSLFISCGPEPKVEITIRYYGNGAEGYMEDQKAYKGEEVILYREAFIYADRTFVGWNTERDGSGESYLDCDTVSFNEDTTLYAQWHINVVEITFNANGGKGAMFPQWAIKGKETTLRQNRFSKEDCHFIGWNTETEGTGTWYSDADTVAFESDTTLYAQWAEDVVTIKFDANGGSGIMFPQWAIKNEATALRPNRFSLKDSHFIGWNTVADGSGTWYPDGDTVKFSENITLYAQWEKDVVTIKYDANGGSGIMFPQWAIKGEATTLRQNRFSKDNNHFIGWKDKNEKWYSDSATAKFEEDTTLVAQWAEDVVTINFDANGGSGWMFPQWAIKGESKALKPNRFSWKDHVFIGWNTNKDGSGTKYADKAEITADNDITLYAQWAVDIVTLEDKYNWKESDGKYFTISDNLTLEEDRPEVRGNITLILPEGKTLSLGFGLGVNKGNSLTIDGSGNLEAEGTSMVYSGIGATIQDDVCGDITINGGNIYVRGGFGGAAIGGACYVDGGTITINGGTIEAVGGSTDWLGYGGAGIGGGGKGSGGNIIINGGKVTATGGENSDGIGKGQEGKDKGKLTLGKGVSIEVSDDGETWSPYKSDKRHRYMRTK